MYSPLTPTSSSRPTIFVAALAAAVCVAGLAATPVEATTDRSGGPGSWSLVEIDAVVAGRKAQMSHDYVAYAPARLVLRFARR